MSGGIVMRANRSGFTEVGHLERISRTEAAFSYAEPYLASEGAAPLSLSLPLRSAPFSADETRPYFEGLLPEGLTRASLASRLEASMADYVTLLTSSGFDCIGDVAVVDADSVPKPIGAQTYDPIGNEEIAKSLHGLESMADANARSRLSLAGTQGKIGLAHDPSRPLSDGWLRPKGNAASTFILKRSSLSRISEFELICMMAAGACGIKAASTFVLDFNGPVIVSERYDRVIAGSGAALSVERLHQEDLAQAFGIPPESKYREIEGGTYHAIAHMVYERSATVAADIEQIARIAVYNYLIGNCDNHLKNISVLHQGGYIQVAPAYDLVCTTFFERLSREMGMRIGSTRRIDEVSPEDFLQLARDLGLGEKRMRAICSELSERFGSAVGSAGASGASLLETLPYSADDIIEDAQPRLRIVAAV